MNYVPLICYVFIQTCNEEFSVERPVEHCSSGAVRVCLHVRAWSHVTPLKFGPLSFNIVSMVTLMGRMDLEFNPKFYSNAQYNFRQNVGVNI